MNYNFNNFAASPRFQPNGPGPDFTNRIRDVVHKTLHQVVPPPPVGHHHQDPRFAMAQAIMEHHLNNPTPGLVPTLPGTKSQNGVRVVHYPERGCFPAAVKTEHFDLEGGKFFKEIRCLAEMPQTQETMSRIVGNLPNIKNEPTEAVQTAQQQLERMVEEAAERKPLGACSPPSLPSPQPVDNIEVKPAPLQHLQQLIKRPIEHEENERMERELTPVPADPPKKQRKSIFQAAPPPPPTEDDEIVCIKMVYNYLAQPPAKLKPEYASIKKEFFEQEQASETVEPSLPSPVQPRERSCSGDACFGSQELVESQIQAPVEETPLPRPINNEAELNRSGQVENVQRRKTPTPPAAEPIAQQNLKNPTTAEAGAPNAPTVKRTEGNTTRGPSTVADPPTFTDPVTTGSCISSAVPNYLAIRKANHKNENKDENRKRKLPPPVAGPKKIRAAVENKAPVAAQKKEKAKPHVRFMEDVVENREVQQAPPARVPATNMNIGNSNSGPKKDAPVTQAIERTPLAKGNNGNSRIGQRKEAPRLVMPYAPKERTPVAAAKTPLDTLDNIMKTMSKPIRVEAPGAKRGNAKQFLEALAKDRKMEKNRAKNDRRQPQKLNGKKKQMISMAPFAVTPQQMYNENGGSRLYGPKSPCAGRSPGPSSSHSSPYSLMES